MKNFWKDLPRPFTILAPMEGVTDVVFRQMMTRIGRPDVFFTEFVMTDGVVSSGREKVVESFKFEPNEQPIVAQIWGTKPEHFYQTAQYVKELGFAGIDINMGCPDRSVMRGGACAGLMKHSDLAQEIIQATKEGGGLPVSVKTRIGFGTEQIEEWIGFLLRQNLVALSVHLRTVKELSRVPAHWELMARIISLRGELAPETLIIGNGDITSRLEIAEKYQQYSCEGFMVGRGIFHNPWMFNSAVELENVTIAQRLDTYLEHIALFQKTWGTSKNPALLKKFCKTYINNFPEAASFREKLMETKTAEELVEAINAYKRAS